MQDGFDLYLHAVFATAQDEWCVVQQGMNGGQHDARRYHWLSEGLKGYFDSPHAGIEGRNVGLIVNLGDARVEHAGVASLCRNTANAQTFNDLAAPPAPLDLPVVSYRFLAHRRISPPMKSTDADGRCLEGDRGAPPDLSHVTLSSTMRDENS